MHEICVIQSCIYMRNTAIATGVLTPSSKRNKYLPLIRWAAKTLLVAAVADCFVLSFRAVARASRFEWVSLDCEVGGKLDRIDRVMRFTSFEVTAKLTVPAAQMQTRPGDCSKKRKKCA